MLIRTASLTDCDRIAELEALCFPQAEAAGRNSIFRRLNIFPDRFWLLEDNGILISFVNGLITDHPDLTDEMYDHAEMHDPSGAWQMIFGVDTHPDYRKQGHAGTVLSHAISCARSEGRKGVVLTCKEKLIPYYTSFGFIDEGISVSTHGDVVWHQMRLSF